MSLNKAQLIGHVGQDPEVRYTPGGASVCNFSIATNERWTDKAGEKHERVEWHRIVVWGKQAEHCAAFLRKGSLVYIEGQIETRSWQDKDGQPKHTTEIKALNVQFLDGRQRDDGEGPAS